MRYLSTYNNIM